MVRREQLTFHGISCETLELDSGGFPCSGVLLLPDAGAARPAATVLLHDAGKGDVLAFEFGALRRRIEAGEMLLLLDVRGRGDGSGDEERAWRVAAMLGRPLLGLRAADAAAVARWLGSRAGVPQEEVAVEGVGLESGLTALLASLCAGLPLRRADGTIGSYLETLDRGWEAPAIFVPGILTAGDVPQFVAAARRPGG